GRDRGDLGASRARLPAPGDRRETAAGRPAGPARRPGKSGRGHGVRVDGGARGVSAGLLAGKVAFITGIARGQGRSHAVRLAREGADIIGLDRCAPMDTMGYPLGSAEEMAETVAEVEKLDRRIVAGQVDVRDRAGMRALLDDGVAQLGRLDIVVASAGAFPACRPDVAHAA